MSRYSLLFATAASVLIFDAHAAKAQAPSNGAQLEEVIVTARRQEESLQSVPVTVQAFTAKAIRELGIRSSNDLMLVTPGIFTGGSGAPNNTLYSIRGQGKPPAGNSPSGVVSYFAEVPLPTQSSAPPQFDLANIQVLKGPQGTLFGRNVLGGAILTYPNKPTHDFGGYLQATLGNYDLHQLEGALNVPIIEDKVALRIAGRWARRDGYVKNLGGRGDPQANVRQDGWRASLLLDPTDWLTNTLMVDYDHDDNDGAGQILRGVVPTNPLFAVHGTFLSAQYAASLARGPRVSDSGAYVPTEDTTRYGLINRTEVTTGFNDIKLINIFGIRHVVYMSSANIDGLPGRPNFPTPGSTFEFLNGNQKFGLNQYSNELQIRGTAFDRKLSWLLGAFYLKEKPNGANYNDLVILNGPASTYNFYTTTSKALFGNFSYDLSAMVEGLKFNVGYRYTWDSASLCGAAAARNPSDRTVTASGCTATNPALINQSVASGKSQAPTWTIGLDYQVNDDVFLYIVSRRGYRAGGVNGPKLGPLFAGYQSFGPETVTDFEGGIRSDWRVGDMTGRFNLSVFTQKNKDVQTPISGLTTAQIPSACQGNPPAPVWLDGDCIRTNDPSSGTLIFNTGETKVKGIEVEAAIRPVQPLTLTFSGSWNKQEIGKQSLPPVGAAVANPSQVYFLHTPKVGYNFTARYDLPVGESLGRMSLSGIYSHVGAINARAVIIKSYNNINLRLDWDGVAGSDVDVAAFVRNVTNNAHPIGPGLTSPTLAWWSLIYNDPRFYGVEVRYRFGAK